MKISFYTHIVKKGTCSVLYNCRTEALSAVENKLADLLEEGDLEKIAAIHPSYYDFLCKSEFIVPDDQVEHEKVIGDWKAQEELPVYTVFINPTLDCNLKCWYCYEKHRKGSMMDRKVFEAVIAHVKQIIKEKNLKRLCLSFFGGEPLLGLQKVVLPFIRQTKEICDSHGIQLHVGFVSNGTLLTPANIKLLTDLHLQEAYSLQISFDGNRLYHDQTKAFASGKGSYDIVLENLRHALAAKMDVLVRLNMTAENISSYYDLLSDLKTFPEELKKKAEIDFQHVWQDGENISPKELLRQQTELRNDFIAAGFSVKELKNIDHYRCYADKSNCICVNYNGDLYKCTARDFEESNREGVLKENGTLVWNEKRALREQLKYGNETCQQCRIYPLCHGGCSQTKMEMQKTKGCIRKRTEEDIDNIIEKRVDYLLEQIILKQNNYE